MTRDYRTAKSTRQTRRYDKPAAKNNQGSFKWVIIGILFGICAAALVFWEYSHKAIPRIEIPSQPHHHHNMKNTAPPAATSQNQTHAPQFDFYTVLPKMQVDAAAGNALPASPAAKIPQTTTAPTSPTTAATVTAAPTTTQATSEPATVTQSTPTTPAADTPANSNTKPIPPLPTATKPAASATQENTEAPTKYALQIASAKSYSEADSLKAQLSMLGLDVVIQKYTINGQTRHRVVAGPFASKQAALAKQQTLRENNISSVVIKTP